MRIPFIRYKASVIVEFLIGFLSVLLRSYHYFTMKSIFQPRLFWVIPRLDAVDSFCCRLHNNHYISTPMYQGWVKS